MDESSLFYIDFKKMNIYRRIALKPKGSRKKSSFLSGPATKAFSPPHPSA